MGVTGIGIGIGIGPFTSKGSDTTVKYFNFPGTNGNYLSTPHSSVLNLAGGVVSFRFAGEVDDGAARYAVYRGTTYRVYTQLGKVNLFSTVTGVVTSTVNYSATDGQLSLFRVDRNATSGDVAFYEKTGVSAENVSSEIDSDSGWSQIGATVSGSTGAFPDQTNVLAIGGDATGTLTWLGKFYRVKIIKDGVAVFDATAASATVGATTFTEDSSNAATVTLNQSGDPQLEVLSA